MGRRWTSRSSPSSGGRLGRAPAMSLPTQRLPSCPTFSSRVISARRQLDPLGDGTRRCPATGSGAPAVGVGASGAVRGRQRLRHDRAPSQPCFESFETRAVAAICRAMHARTRRENGTVWHTSLDTKLTKIVSSHIPSRRERPRLGRRDLGRADTGPAARGHDTCGDQRGSQNDLSSHLPRPRHGRARWPRPSPRAAAPPRASPAPAGSAGGGGSGAATYWFLTGQPQESIRKNTVDRFNAANPDTPIDQHGVPERRLQDEDQDRHRRRPGAHDHLGLGRRRSHDLRRSDQVEDLTSWFDENAAVKDKLFPSSFGAATVDGKIYAMPAETVQPIVLYYNKSVFEKVGAQPPELVGRHHGAGPEVQRRGHRAVLARRPVPLDEHDVARVPVRPASVARRSSRPRSTARRTPGPTRRSSTAHQDAGPGQGQRLHQGLLLDHGRLQRRPGPALHRQGRDDAARRVDVRQHEERRRRLRQGRPPRLDELPAASRAARATRPTPSATPASTSRSRRRPPTRRRRRPRSSSPPACSTTTEVKAWIDAGTVPIVKGADSNFGSAEDAELLKFVYDVSSNAKVFAQSWDQALPPTAAETLLDNIAKLFQLSITPEQWVDTMNAGHRTVTPRPAPRPPRPPHRPEPPSGVHSRSLGWLALPALVFFTAFGVIPLIGVLRCQLHHLGRDRRDRAVRPDSWRPCSPIPGSRTPCGSRSR